MIQLDANGFRRQAMSSTTRHVLTEIASGNLDSSWPGVAEDWDAILDGVYGNGLLGLTDRYLSQGVDRHVPPPAFRSAIERASMVTKVHMSLMNRWIVTVGEQFSAAGIDVIVLKGPALATSVYCDPSLRTYGDLDLMVRERDMVAAHAVLVGMGFSPERDLSRIPSKLTPWCTTYEVQYVDPASQFVLEMHYDDLLNAGFASRTIEGFWERSVNLEFHGIPLKTLCPEDHLVHLCAHMHFHGYVKLIWFSDLIFLLHASKVRFDWNAVIQVTLAEEAQTPVYYSLLFLGQLFDVDVPGDVLATLKPDRARVRMHEYFLPADKVLSLEPMARPAFSFYHLPLCKRMLPDLLAMGRRREKLQYLLRLLVPPSPWLYDYYGLCARQQAAQYRLMHPFRLWWHYARELTAIPRKSGPWWSGEQ